MEFIHELPTWPNLNWDEAKISALVANVCRQQGVLIGRMSAYGFSARQEAMLKALTEETVKSSAIEGEVLNADAVRSSIARRLKLHVAGVSQKPDRNVDRVMTDESTIYPFAFDGFCASKHETIAHKYEYVRGDVHTNTIESAFSLFKRGVTGSFHRVSHKHLHRYLSEFEYRFNRRTAPALFAETVANLVETKPMEYKTLVS